MAKDNLKFIYENIASIMLHNLYKMLEYFHRKSITQIDDDFIKEKEISLSYNKSILKIRFE